MKAPYRWVIALFAPALVACLSVEGTQEIDTLPPGGHHVLFIGNSLTYTNDLPGTVARLAASVGDTIRVAQVALPNFAVIDHALGMSNALDVIKSQQWELVVLQQGPTTTAINRDTLIIATKLLDPLVKSAGGRTAQLMAWPQSVSPQLFPLVRASSQAAANSVEGGMFIPAGEAWRVALEQDPSINLYGPDGYHPGPLGTYLAALVVYEKVTGYDARQLPGTAAVGGATLTVPETTVRFLQNVAHQVVAEF
ncbi:MAG TPA: hypothetical protein VF042_10080 [Gemmatimonadaceae bacterium]